MESATPIEVEHKGKVIFVLERAPLEVVKFKGKAELLNSSDHKDYIIRKMKSDPSKYRPDITHQCLLALLDSPLNKSGCMDIFIQTEKNVLIHVNPITKIPRTYERFARLVAQLLTKLKIQANEEEEPLLKVLKNSITNHIPANTIKVGTSIKGRLVNLHEFIPTLGDVPLLFVVGAVAKGNPTLECDYLDDVVSISRYNLSAVNCITKIENVIEQMWNIV